MYFHLLCLFVSTVTLDVDESKSGSEVSQGAELKHQSEGSVHQEEESTDQGTFELKNRVSVSVTDQKLGMIVIIRDTVEAKKSLRIV